MIYLLVCSLIEKCRQFNVTEGSDKLCTNMKSPVFVNDFMENNNDWYLVCIRHDNYLNNFYVTGYCTTQQSIHRDCV